ncbi:hypothetical protein A7A08_02171 [Methyloligella halotolerans]|uniref:Uncharacterized protein n=1 Tax=Methyloligella halotolerans TaxID=1177755 RepID=A0A1E2RXC5_9HYPH|nr:hypothetical protein A7A08_02171 [Methyloligella halotolerans]
MASPKPKPKKQDEKPDKPQSERFKETAREVEADQSGALFNKALERVLRPGRSREDS